MFDESVTDRFWAKVDKNGPTMPHMQTPCWVWTASKKSTGYGQLILKDKRCMSAHRLSYMLEHGDIPAEMHICHKCDNPSCVRVDHLYLGTPRDNGADRKERGPRLDPEVRKANDKATQKAYYEQNRDRLLEEQKQYRDENREREKERKRIWYEQNRDRVHAQQREYRESREWQPKSKENAPFVRLRIPDGLRSAIRDIYTPDVPIDAAIISLITEALNAHKKAA